VRLGATTSSDLLGRIELRLVIPLGATEQHGPHLPLETDTVIAGGIALALAAVRADVIVAPPLAYGSSGEHAGFPGTLSIGQSALEEVVVETSLMLAPAPELVREARPVGATAPLEQLLPRLRQDGVKAVAENGVLGDARSASDRAGRGLLAQLVADLNDLLGG
jgi:mycofactocin precursor peptide peptidase